MLAFDPKDGWTLFVPRATDEERVWIGDPGDVLGEPRENLDTWLKARAGRPVAVLGAPIGNVAADADLSDRLRWKLAAVRRRKDATEIATIRKAVAATARGYARIRGELEPGVTERQVQIELEAEFFRAGGQRTGYGTIVGFGTNAAVLHFEPSGRVLKPGEIVLIDAGAEIDGYCADVTRTYAATPEQRDLHAMLLDVQTKAVARCSPGAQWRDLHLAACLDLARGLADLDILEGAPEGLVERDVHALFMPHGLGHMVGLGVRDGASAPPRPPETRPTLKYLRIHLPLEEGFVVTVEPGVYFIPAILNNAEHRAAHGDAVRWGRVDRMLDLGGLRIEDNVHVTAKGPENLTAAIPKV